MKKLSLWLFLGLLALVLAACGDTDTSEETPETIADVAVATDDLSILVEALTQANLVETLEGEGPFTVFAPTNAAFEALLEELQVTKEALLAREDLADILTYHVVSGQALKADAVIASAPGSVATVQGDNLSYAVEGESVVLTDARGRKATVTSTDIEASNGVIHLMDNVVLPAEEVVEPTNTIVDVALANPDFSILVEALTAANLVDALKAEGPFTVFAPTNAAFEATLTALEITKEELLAREDLADILTYHVVSGKILSTDVTEPGTVATLHTGELSYSLDDMGMVVLTGGQDTTAMVTQADIAADNGVIHAIDSVLLPTDKVVSTSYPINALGDSGVSGTAKFKQLSDTETEVSIALTGTTEGNSHPAHIHEGSSADNGGIYQNLTNVDGATGESVTTLSLAYEDLIAYDGYINIHLSGTDLATIVATGETGANADAGGAPASPAPYVHKH
ncbi:MAG: fasciclin domain-containing protein [Trueperaceae bacterium]